jgi:hypothetical protein
MTCRCTCKAYGRSCDCRFDGLTQGRASERSAVVALLRKWAKDPVLAHADAAETLNDAANAIERSP